jgi:hypothetical protein
MYFLFTMDWGEFFFFSQNVRRFGQLIYITNGQSKGSRYSVNVVNLAGFLLRGSVVAKRGGGGRGVVG